MLELRYKGDVVRTVPENVTISYGDGHWLSPTKEGWVDGNWSLTRAPVEQIEPDYPLLTLTRVQFRKLLRANGYDLDAITASINALPEGDLKENFKEYWEHSYDFEASNPLTIAAAQYLLGLSQQEMEYKWRLFNYGLNDVEV